jgi:fluoride exporter
VRSSLATYLAVGLGAGLGGMCRYAVMVAVVGRFGPGFPLGTIFINVSGSFLIGVVAQLALTRALGFDPLLRVALTAGVLGGYTTFSTFAFDALTLGSEREWRLATLYVFASVGLGIAACYGGLILARLMIRTA